MDTQTSLKMPQAAGSASRSRTSVFGPLRAIWCTAAIAIALVTCVVAGRVSPSADEASSGPRKTTVHLRQTIAREMR